jgi:hypothetical protein
MQIIKDHPFIACRQKHTENKDEALKNQIKITTNCFTKYLAEPKTNLSSLKEISKRLQILVENEIPTTLFEKIKRVFANIFNLNPVLNEAKALLEKMDRHQTHQLINLQRKMNAIFLLPNCFSENEQNLAKKILKDVFDSETLDKIFKIVPHQGSINIAITSLIRSFEDSILNDIDFGYSYIDFTSVLVLEEKINEIKKDIHSILTIHEKDCISEMKGISESLNVKKIISLTLEEKPSKKNEELLALEKNANSLKIKEILISATQPTKVPQNSFTSWYSNWISSPPQAKIELTKSEKELHKDNFYSPQNQALAITRLPIAEGEEELANCIKTLENLMDEKTIKKINEGRYPTITNMCLDLFDPQDDIYEVENTVCLNKIRAFLENIRPLIKK